MVPGAAEDDAVKVTVEGPDEEAEASQPVVLE